MFVARNELENKTAQPTASRTWQCVSSKTGELISVTMQQSCSTSGVQCLTNAPSLPPASDVKVTVNVVLAEHNLITSWHLPDGLHHIQGFRVLCLHPRETDSSNNAEHISPFLGSQLRSYTLTDVDDDTQYKVCVDVMHNQTHIFKRVCKLMQEKETNVLVGILAGSIFLIPCFMFVIYIIVKDRRINSGLNQDDDTDSHNCQSLSASAALCQGSAMEETADCPFLQNDSSTIVVPMLKQSNVHQPAQAVWIHTSVSTQTNTIPTEADSLLSSVTADLTYTNQTQSIISMKHLPVQPPQLPALQVPGLTENPTSR